jgi:hypothetical protein
MLRSSAGLIRKIRQLDKAVHTHQYLLSRYRPFNLTAGVANFFGTFLSACTNSKKEGLKPAATAQRPAPGRH